MACASCGGPVPQSARFCPNCGAGVHAAREPERDELREVLERHLSPGYRIVRLLGKGGMGAVYLAAEPALEREVAIKVLPPGLAETEELRERFRREVKVAARLSHPSIVPLHVFGEAEGLLYFVMGYVRGESLAARLRRDGALPEAEARRILAELADGLDYAHGEGIVHRDVKPENVMLDDRTGRAMLMDFGLAKLAGTDGSLTQEGSLLGTPHYMSPEQIAGEELDGRTDLYSLGVLGYAMLAGQLPFEGDSAQVLTQHLSREPAPLPTPTADVSQQVASAVMRCLAKDPAQRWPDAASFRDALPVELIREEEIPQKIDDLESLGFLFAVLLLAAGAATWIRWYLYGDPFTLEGPIGIAPALLSIFQALLPFVVGMGLVGGLVQGARAGIPWTENLRISLLAPTWLPGWIPLPCRRRGDVWKRLPPLLRSTRRWASTATVLGALVLLASLAVMAKLPLFDDRGDFPTPLPLPLFLALQIAFFGALGVFAFRARTARRWAGPFGLPRHHRRELLFGPTGNPDFWRLPQIQSLLLTGEDAESDGTPPEEAPRGPAEVLAAIEASVASGFGSETRERVISCARTILQEVEELDGETLRLTRSLEPGQSEVLGRRIARLEGQEDDESARLRELLSQQRALVGELERSLHRIRARRDRRIEQLRMLLLQLERFRASGRPSRVDPAVDDRLRRLCKDLETRAVDDGGGEDSMPTLTL